MMEMEVKWSRLLNRTNVLILDTETTGFGSEAEVIEIALIDTTGEVRMNFLSLPQGSIATDASDVHGLTYEELRAVAAPPWPKIHRKVRTAMEGAALVLCWNAPFDRRMLEQTANRHGLSIPRTSWHDLLKDYRAIRPGGRHTLDAAANREGVAIPEPAHRALSDCRKTLAVMRAVVRGA